MGTFVAILIAFAIIGGFLWMYFKPEKKNNENTYDPNVDYDDTEIDDTEPPIKPPKI